MSEKQTPQEPRRSFRRTAIDILGRDLFLGDIIAEGHSIDGDESSYGFISLEELLHSYFPYYTPQQYKKIESEILGRYSDLRGGCDMFAWDDIDLSQDSPDTI